MKDNFINEDKFFTSQLKDRQTINSVLGTYDDDLDKKESSIDLSNRGWHGDKLLLKQ